MSPSFLSLPAGAWLAPMVALVLVACAGTPVVTPAQAIQQAATQLDQAQRHYVEDYDSPTLKQARAKLAAAHKALAAQQPKHARALAQEADLSIELATIQAQASRNTANRKHVQRQVDTLEQLSHEPPAGGAP